MDRRSFLPLRLWLVGCAALLIASAATPSLAQICGNGAPECPGEECDDGNLSDADSCPTTCKEALCGDGFLCTDGSCTSGPSAGPEECDDGNTQDDVTCCADCGLPPCGADDDGDGEAVPGDNCPRVANASQQDSDGDGVGDACDNCKATANPAQEDDDDDLRGNDCDNCDAAPNPEQADGDSDGVGDACEKGEKDCIAAKMQAAAKYAASTIKCTSKAIRKGTREEEDCRQKAVQTFLDAYQKKVTAEGCDDSDRDDTKQAAEEGAEKLTRGTTAPEPSKVKEKPDSSSTPPKPSAPYCVYKIRELYGNCSKVKKGSLLCLDCPTKGTCPPTTSWLISPTCKGVWDLYTKECAECPRDGTRGFGLRAGGDPTTTTSTTTTSTTTSTTSTTTTTLPPPCAPCTAFVTQATFDGNLGGLAAADANCQGAAVGAGLPGTYLAWLVDGISANSPNNRFTHSTGAYKRTDGVTIANDWADLTDGTLAAPLDHNQFGGSVALGPVIDVWTAASSSGAATTPHCNAWTSGDGGDFGSIGKLVSPGTGWSIFGSIPCTGPAHLYCFEQ